MNETKKLVSQEIKMSNYKGNTLIGYVFDNCTFIDFANTKIINCNIHNCVFNNSDDFLLALESNKLTKCRTNFTGVFQKIIRSSNMDLVEEIQKVMDLDEKFAGQTLVVFKNKESKEN